MTRVLLDTHAFLWFVFDDARLSARAASVIAEPETAKLIGIGTLWEIAIKVQIGKLTLGMELSEFFERHVGGRIVEMVPVGLEHLVEYGRLPLSHRDPFDRLLVAQARVLGVPIVSGDPSFGRYDVDVIW